MEGTLRMTMVSASVLGADLLRLGEEIDRAKEIGVQWLHLDHMDGHFVPNISFGPDFVAAMRKRTDLFLDVHLMLSHPMRYIDAYAKAGADLIAVHAEAEDEAEKALMMIREKGIKAAVAINPGTAPQTIEGLLPLCDMVLVMTVEPGFGGQSLREDCLAKLPVLREMIRKTGREILIEVDGGIKQENARRAFEAGADVLVMGTGLFRAKEPAGVLQAVMEAGKTCGR